MILLNNKNKYIVDNKRPKIFLISDVFSGLLKPILFSMLLCALLFSNHAFTQVDTTEGSSKIISNKWAVATDLNPFSKRPANWVPGIPAKNHIVNIFKIQEGLTEVKEKSPSNKMIGSTIDLDPTNITGAGGIDINTIACSSGYEILATTNTGATANLVAPSGVDVMYITLTNPQDIGDESISITTVIAGLTVIGNGTTSLTIQNTGLLTPSGVAAVFDELQYANASATPNTGVTRIIDVVLTDIDGDNSNTAQAFFTVTQASNSGGSNGAVILFDTDVSSDLNAALDGSQDAGGTWLDIDGTGALTGSVISVAGLPLGGSTFRYQVNGSAPCGNVGTTVVVVKMLSTELSVTSNTNCGTYLTTYADPTFSANSDDPIYTFKSLGTVGDLECEDGGVGATYTWYLYDQASNSYVTFPGNTTRVQTGLADGGYLVVRNVGGTILEGRAWVWNLTSTPSAGADVTVCQNSTVSILGFNNLSSPNYDFYDPIARPLIIDATTSITVTFDGIHTWVSDLEFHMVSPDGLVSIPLGVRHGGNCNHGNDISNLSFTSDP
ncbi:MAG: hypothetical protein ACI8U0_002423, partial [Flavobacteriales bacterium]